MQPLLGPPRVTDLSLLSPTRSESHRQRRQVEGCVRGPTRPHQQFEVTAVRHESDHHRDHEHTCTCCAQGLRRDGALRPSLCRPSLRQSRLSCQAGLLPRSRLPSRYGQMVKFCKFGQQCSHGSGRPRPLISHFLSPAAFQVVTVRISHSALVRTLRCLKVNHTQSDQQITKQINAFL